MSIFYDGPEGLVRALLSAPLIYAAVILATRLSGKRSTSQMNNFDWIVTVAMGSMVASPILFRDIAVAEALTGIGMLLLLQFLATWAMQRFQGVRSAVRARPSLLYFDGAFQRDRMRKERVSEEEIASAVRAKGHHSLDDVAAVILETDAKLSVIPKERETGTGRTRILRGVEGYDERYLKP